MNFKKLKDLQKKFQRISFNSPGKNKIFCEVLCVKSHSYFSSSFSFLKHCFSKKREKIIVSLLYVYFFFRHFVTQSVERMYSTELSISYSLSLTYNFSSGVVLWKKNRENGSDVKPLQTSFSFALFTEAFSKFHTGP